jgi:hypothetical protein
MASSVTTETVTGLYKIWQALQKSECWCINHDPKNQFVCNREKAWRKYCSARDELMKQNGEEKFDIRSILDAFEES